VDGSSERSNRGIGGIGYSKVLGDVCSFSIRIDTQTVEASGSEINRM